MSYITRVLDLEPLLKKSTVFLFGPRQTGKSTYIREKILALATKSYSLLDHGLLHQFKADPSRLSKEVQAEGWRDCLLIIDEVQKCPELLDEVHKLIEERGIRFLLTGSSARSLKRSGVNLLGGRGRDRVFHPFCWIELSSAGKFNLLRTFNHGTIPNHYLDNDPDELLNSYISRYLAEEIIAEGISRNIPAFSRFLETAAANNAQQLDFTSLASDAGVSRQTAQNYFQILKDTLIGYELPAYTKTGKRKAVSTSKFYFFDMGVVRALRRFEKVLPGTKEFGDFFEHFIFLELRTWIDIRKPTATLHYWRSTSAFEVDFILGQKVAIEVKSTEKPTAKQLKGLFALEEENLFERFIVVCQASTIQVEGNIVIYPWERFLEDLWAEKILSS